MIRTEIFVSGGAEIDELRNVSLEAFRRLEHMFIHELGTELSIGNWDFRIDAARVVPRGALALRSLQMVEMSQACVGIFGTECPDVTTQEIRHCFELRRDGERVEVFVFVNPDLRTAEHDDFFAAIRDEFGEQVVWAPYYSALEFQAALITTLVPYLIRRLGINLAPLGEAA